MVESPILADTQFDHQRGPKDSLQIRGGPKMTSAKGSRKKSYFFSGPAKNFGLKKIHILGQILHQTCRETTTLPPNNIIKVNR